MNRIEYQMYLIEEKKYVMKEELVFAKNMRYLLNQMMDEIEHHLNQVEYYHRRKRMVQEFMKENQQKSTDRKESDNEYQYGEMKNYCHRLKKNVEQMNKHFEYSHDRIEKTLQHVEESEDVLFTELDNLIGSESDTERHDDIVHENETKNHCYQLDQYLVEQQTRHFNEMYQCDVIFSSDSETHSQTDSVESSEDHSVHNDTPSLGSSEESGDDLDVVMMYGSQPINTIDISCLPQVVTM